MCGEGALSACGCKVMTGADTHREASGAATLAGEVQGDWQLGGIVGACCEGVPQGGTSAKAC